MRTTHLFLAVFFVLVVLYGICSVFYFLGVTSQEKIQTIHITRSGTYSIVTNKFAYDYMSPSEVKERFGITIKQ